MKSDLSHVKMNHEDLVMKHIDDEIIIVFVPEVMEEAIEVVPHKEVLHVHFIDEVVKMPVTLQKQVQVIQEGQRTVEIPQAQYIDKTVDVPVVKQGRVPTTQTVLKTIEESQVQYQEVIRQVPVPQPFVQTVEKTVEVPQVQYTDRIVGVPVVKLHRKLWKCHK